MFGDMQIYFEYYDFDKHPQYNIKPKDKPEQKINGDMRYQIYFIFKNIILVIWIKKDIEVVYIKHASDERERQGDCKYQQ